MKKILIIGAIAVCAIILVVTLILGNLNSIIKKGVETVGPKVLQAPVTLNKVDISLFSGSGQLDGLTIGNPAGFQTEYAFRLGRIKVDLDPKSIASNTIHIRDIEINDPQIMFEGGFSKNNLEQLQKNAASYSAPAGKEGAPAAESKEAAAGSKKILIDHLAIKNGSISASMTMLKGQKLIVPLPPIEIKDIGKGQEATVSEAMQKILGAVYKAVIPAVQSQVANFDETLKQRGGSLQKEVEKGVGSLKGLLKK
jgi:hypothetical protein